LSHRSYDRKWGRIQKWMEDSERARYSLRSSHRSYLGADDLVCARNIGSHRVSTYSSLDVSGSHSSRTSTSRRRDLVRDGGKDRSTRHSLSNHAYSDSHSIKKSSSSHKDLLSGFYHDQRNYSSLRHNKPISTYHTRSSSLYSDPSATTKTYRVSPSVNTGLIRSASLASLCGNGLYSSYNSHTPSEYSYSSRASSARSSPVFTDNETGSTTSSNRAIRGRSDSMSTDFSDQSETAADYFSRSNRRGSIVSDVDDVNIPDLNS
ncbi:unnamed protein product, partial [Lepidochelys olivacea]